MVSFNSKNTPIVYRLYFGEKILCFCLLYLLMQLIK